MKGCEIMKALASDFGGALYLHDAAESYREGDTVGIGQLQEQGCLLGLCTGHPLWGIIAFLSKRLHPDFYIVSSEAMILDRDQRVLFESCLLPETAKRLSMLTKDVESTAVQAGRDIYAYKKTRAFTNIPVIHDIEEIKGQQIHGLSFCMADEAAVEQLYSSFERQFSDTCAAFQNQNFVGAVSYGCSRGKALLKLKKLMNLDSYYDIGDSYNDIPMLQDADVSSAFHASPKRVKETADHLADSVGEAIQSYMLRKEN